MKKLLITLMLISPASFADWGDVYYCQMTTHSLITFEGKRSDEGLKKFMFKLDRTKNAMVFGKKGWFDGGEIELKNGLKLLDSLKEYWSASDEEGMAYFQDGKFVWSSVGSAGIQTSTANCDKF